MAALKRSTHIDPSYCGGNFKWRFVGKYSCNFKVSILNHFLRTWTWKPTTTSFTNRQLVTSYEILVASTEFLVTLATRKAQFEGTIWVLVFHSEKRQPNNSNSEFNLNTEAVIECFFPHTLFYVKFSSLVFFIPGSRGPLAIHVSVCLHPTTLDCHMYVVKR